MKFGATIKSLAVFCLVNNLTPSVKADQPVHCLQDDVFGEWEFVANAQADTVNIYSAADVCTHQRPNKVQIVSSSHIFKFPKEEKWKVTLLSNYIATATKDGQSFTGTWSTIYDQAMKVELNDGTRFVTNFRYSVDDSVSKDPVADGLDAFR